MTYLVRISSIITLLMLCACSSTQLPTRFYTLSGPVAPAAQQPDAAPLLIEVLPIRVPERLARPQIVINSAKDAAQVRILEQERWASHFDQELHAAFTQALTARLGAIDVAHGMRSAGARTYRIAIELVQFDAVPDEQLSTRFSWSLKASDSAETMLCQTALAEPVSGGIAGMVQGMQRAVNEVTQAIASNISARAAGQSGSCGQPAA